MQAMNSMPLDLLRCPATGARLEARQGELVGPRGDAYPILAGGIPLFATQLCSDDGRRQAAHFDRVAASYLANLDYPHTQEYGASLDRVFIEEATRAPLGVVAEICCGRGEAFDLLAGRIERGIGVDVSVAMLEQAVRSHERGRAVFVQGDATSLPLADGAFDTVVMLGGIHHVSDRPRLFAEVARILRPGGRFLWREPLSDFVLWRALRAVIYRWSPALDHQTERPLQWGETAPVLESVGLELRTWRPCGFIGFCLLMNSDILVFNRAFRFIPGIRPLARWAARFDEWLLRCPGLRSAGLQVVGVAVKPGQVAGAQ